MRGKQFTAVLLLLALMFTMIPMAEAAPDDTVYVRKHVSLVYDNSGSMKQKQDNIKNLKWAYASYAAQIFAGLLNETDTLDLTLMNAVNGVSSLSVDLTGDRQIQVDRIRDATTYAEDGTPLTSIGAGEGVLTGHGLLTDKQIGDNSISTDEQFWLVLTTDGRFDNGNVTKEQLEAALEQRLVDYSNLQLVYFGIGAEGDTSSQAAYDLRDSRLTSYPNFTAVYAEKQEQIVATMQALANRISGRYSVSDGVKFHGTEVTLWISGESSPIRNIAVLAQQTDARLLSAVDEEGTKLTVARAANQQYPYNSSPGYDNMDAGTKGAHTALLTHPNGKFKPGSVTLTFSEPVNEQDFSLMYEPAVYIKLIIQQKDASGNWVDLAPGQKVRGGQPIRISHEICEDGTNVPLSAEKLAGITKEHITCGDQVVRKNSEFVAPSGNFNITATVSMLGGSYTISTVQSMQAVSLDDYSFRVSDPLSFYPEELAANTDLYIDFTVLYEGQPATADQMADFSINGGDLEGTVATPGGGVFRFTPKQEGCLPGDRTVELCFQDQCVASQTVTVKELVIRYEAKAGNNLTLFSNTVQANTEPVIFAVTRIQGETAGPLPEEEAGNFRIEAKTNDGTVLKGLTTYVNGALHFVTNDTNAQPGDYTVTLYHQDEAMAGAHITILKYNAQFTAQVFQIGDGTVDLFDLRNNESALAFVVYADGEACTGVQLENMLGNMLLLEHDCPESIMELDSSVGAYQGKAALIVRPTAAAATALGAWFDKTGIALRLLVGLLSEDSLHVTLTVQAEKGSQITGTLELCYNRADMILFLILLLALLVIGGLILYILYCCVHKSRIRAGVLRYYKLTKNESTYILTTKTFDELKWKFSMNTRPEQRPTRVNMVLQAPKSISSRLFRPAVDPEAVISFKSREQLDQYFYWNRGATAGNFQKLLQETAQRNQILKPVVENMLQSPASRTVRGLKPNEGGVYTPSLQPGAMLLHKTDTGTQRTVEVWIYEIKTKKENEQTNNHRKIR